ncbi:MAG: hypothetical protein KBT45_02940 [Bacteroidales bacterium]|nr:hypothetical protein [Candidatus Colimorpha pelethequi]
MKTNIFLLALTCLLFMSCNNSKTVEYTPALDVFSQHEWVSFTTKTSCYEKGEWQFDRYCSQVIIHNADTSREIAFIKDNGIIVLLTPDKITHIDLNYQVVATYNSDNEFYEELAIDMLQGPLDFFPMIYESDLTTVVSYGTKATIEKVTEDDTLYAFPATKLEKHCYTNGKCKLKDAPITLIYSTQNGCFVEARQSQFELFKRSEIISTISNIKFDDRSQLIDSLFNLENYKDFEFVSDTNYLPDRIWSSNTEANEEVLNYPIVNLRTGDTVTLGKMNGNIVLCLFNFYLDEEIYNKVESTLADADNVVWLIPSSNNVKKLTELANANHWGDDIYYTKGFNLILADYYYYYFDENHEIKDYCESMHKLDQLIVKNLRKNKPTTKQ